MKVCKVFLGALSGSLTCSEVMELLMDQPTKPVGRKIESHAHMHATEGFKISPTGFTGDLFSLDRKKLHWEKPSHLYPQGHDNDFGRFVYQSGASGKDHGVYKGVFQDPDRLPPTREYVNRTGLDSLPAIPGPTQYHVFKKRDRQAPVKETYTSMDQIRALTKTAYTIEKSGEIRVLVEQAKNLAPPVEASPAHTMFPDVESLVMHLTAAFRSDAGQRALHYLNYSVAPGANLTVGIFSKTAVRAVTAADTSVPNRLIARKLEVDQLAPRDPDTGLYPATGKVLTHESAIDHVVVVLGHRASGDLNVLTCFPSRQTTGNSIGTATTPDEDIAEFVFTQHTKVTQARALPVLRW